MAFCEVEVLGERREVPVVCPRVALNCWVLFFLGHDGLGLVLSPMLGRWPADPEAGAGGPLGTSTGWLSKLLLSLTMASTPGAGRPLSHPRRPLVRSPSALSTWPSPGCPPSLAQPSPLQDVSEGSTRPALSHTE